MKIKSAILSVLLLLSLCACSSEPVVEVSEGRPLVGAFQSGTPSESSAASESAGISETPVSEDQSLTLFFTGNGAMKEQPYYIMAQEFMKYRTDVKIEFSYVDLEGSLTPVQIQKKLKGLKNGDGADLIEISHMVGMKDLKQDIGFVDLNKLMDSDPNFSRQDYFEGILNAMSTDGKIYIAPLSFGFTYLSLNRQFERLLDERFERYQTVDFKQMLDIYDTASGDYRGDATLYLVNYPMDNTSAHWAYDINDMESADTFTSPPESVKLLNRWTSVPRLSNNTFTALVTGGKPREEAEWVFEGNSYLGSNLGCKLFDYPQTEYTKPVLRANLNGDVEFAYNQSLTINEKCPNQALAWDFVKFCMENKPVTNENGDPIFAFDYSINKESFRTQYEIRLAEDYDTNAAEGLIPSENKQTSVKNAADYMVLLAERCDRLNEARYIYFSGIISDYWDGKQTFDKTIEYIETVIREYLLSK